MKLGNILN